MKEKSLSIEKIKNWFIIFWIRLVNIVKEHKYISAGIGVLLCTCVIVLVAFADEDRNAGKIISNVSKITVYNEKEEITDENPALSFSTINFNISFKLKCKDGETCIESNRKAVIEAKIPASIDASWVDTGSYERLVKIDEVTEGSNKYNRIVYTINNEDLPISAGEKTETDTITETIYLKLNNINNGNIIQPEIKVYDSAYEDEEKVDLSVIPKTYVKSEDLHLDYKIVEGYKYIGEDGKRYVPIGIILGYNGESLTGKHFIENDSFDIFGLHDLHFSTDENLYGVFDSSTNNFISKDKMPHYIYDPNYSNFVYDSGTVTFSFLDDDMDENNSNSYALEVFNIRTDGNIYYSKDGFVGLGSYFITAIVDSDKDSFKMAIFNDEYEISNLKKEQKGTQTLTGKIYSQNSKSSEKVTLTYDEEAYLDVNFTHSIDSSYNLENVGITIPINSNFDLIKYDEANEYYINDEYKNTETDDKVSAKYMCSNGDESATYAEAIDNQNCGGITSVTYTINEVKKGTNVNIKLKLKTKDNEVSGETSYGEITSNIDIKSTVNGFTVTPFKANAKVVIDGKESNEINVDVSKTTNIKIYPSIYSNSVYLNEKLTDLFNYFLVQVDLPDGISYVDGSSNINVSNIIDKRLTYIIKYNVNGNIPSISFNINSDLDISETKEIKVKYQAISCKEVPAVTMVGLGTIGATIEDMQSAAYAISILNGPFYKDNTSIDERTITKSIIYRNSGNVIYRNNATDLYISKNKEFGFETEVYNATSESKNISLILELPSKDSDAVYTGDYSVSNVPDNALCAFEYDSLDDVSWDSCSEDINDSNTKLIKIDNIELNTNSIYKSSITLEPNNNNKVGDKYKYSSYIYIDDEMKSISSVTTSVYSRRISGNVWEDFNEDGLMDFDESKVEGVELLLHKITYKNEKADDPIVKTDDVVSTTKSDYKGNYEFLAYDDGNEIEDGYYYIEAKYYNQKYGLTISREDIINESEKSIFKASDEESEEASEYSFAKTENFEIGTLQKNITDKNLGLTLKKVYSVSMSKYLTRAVTTNALGISTTKEFGDKVTFAKLDVKDINNLTIKVVYTIEVQNTGYYPGYVYAINDYIPDGMSFNTNYEENKNWVVDDNGILVYKGLQDTLINGGEKKYVTLALDISSKEAGSFINYATVSEDDIKIFSRTDNLLESGDINE